MGPLAIQPLTRSFDASLELPGSKSITNRYLLLAALATGTSTLERVLVADDIGAMLDCIESIGARCELAAGGTFATVKGTGGAVATTGRAFARQSGTTARFIAPVLALTAGPWELDGAAQLRSRPMADLFYALAALGASITAEQAAASLPAVIRGPLSGGRASISGSVSSQFLSGLLLAAPLIQGGLEIEVTDSLVSRPYVEMTIATMRDFGAIVEGSDDVFSVAATGYRAADVAIEPDASSASYFFGAAAALGGSVVVPGLSSTSLQGDISFVDVLEQMGAVVTRSESEIAVRGKGVLHGIDIDMAGLSDTVPTLAVVASFADSPTRIRGVGFIRNKESDRVGGVVRELARCGITAEEEPDGLVIYPGQPHAALVTTYDDHRMAMAFSILGLAAEGIEIDDPTCVGKTFPTFFDVLDELRRQ